MATYNIGATSPSNKQDSSVEFSPTTATSLISFTSTSQTRTTANPLYETWNNISSLTKAFRWPLQGRRPAYGLQYPRGNYNK